MLERSEGIAVERPMQTRRPLVRPWTPDEISALKQLWAEEVPIRSVAARLRRTTAAVLKLAHKLGLSRRVRSNRKVVPAEQDELREQTDV